jgi:hypothetical protein
VSDALTNITDQINYLYEECARIDRKYKGRRIKPGALQYIQECKHKAKLLIAKRKMLRNIY